MPSKTRRAIRDLADIDTQQKIEFPCRKTTRSSVKKNDVIEKEKLCISIPSKTRKRSTILSKYG